MWSINFNATEDFSDFKNSCVLWSLRSSEAFVFFKVRVDATVVSNN